VEALLATDAVDPSRNGVLARLVELEVETLVDQGAELAVHAIVADADDRCLGPLDYLDEGPYSTTVASADPIDFVHDDDALLGHRASHDACKRVLVRLLLL